MASSDLTLLPEITEAGILEALKKRYHEDEIYTSVGPGMPKFVSITALVIVAVNPFKSIDKLFSKDKEKSYRGQRHAAFAQPHIFALADNAFQQMKLTLGDQVVLIAGESGSGKTEASKYFLRYISNCVNADSNPESKRRIEQVQKVMILANPLLEAFGNAKTTRNDNSSRFGKYMVRTAILIHVQEIEFSYSLLPIAGKISTYLLEKSRVSQIPVGERNFHIFYQVLKGASDDLLKRLKLTRNSKDYRYLSSSGSDVIPGVDDSKDFQELLKNTADMEISQDHIDGVFDIIAAILHLGNVQFTSVSEGVSVNDMSILQNVADLLKVDLKILERSLRFRELKDVSKQNKNVMEVPLSRENAIVTRDTLAKTLYSRAFDKIISLINAKLQNTKNSGCPESISNVIGVLDIYGFESMASNGFEQFVINYCNEKLQQIFIELVLKQEQEEYAREGIEWHNVEFFNNKVCIFRIFLTGRRYVT